LSATSCLTKLRFINIKVKFFYAKAPEFSLSYCNKKDSSKITISGVTLAALFDEILFTKND
jgi:hypothetical protein